MWLRTSCEMRFDITVPTPFILMLRLRSGAQQWVACEEYRLLPAAPVYEFTDNYGNLCQRLIAPPGAFAIYTSADVMTADSWISHRELHLSILNICQILYLVICYPVDIANRTALAKWPLRSQLENNWAMIKSRQSKPGYVLLFVMNQVVVKYLCPQWK